MVKRSLYPAHSHKAVTSRRPNPRRLYDQTSWRKLSKQFLARNPLCKACSKRGRERAATITDHIVEHKGDVELFWDMKNLQPLCATCHGRKHGNGLDGPDVDGLPIGEDHHWNK